MTENIEEPEPAIGDAPPKERVLFSNKRYDQLKWIAQVFLPALATFYVSLGDLWGFPKVQETVGTIIALDLFLGLLLGLATRQYEHSGAKYAGAIHLNKVMAQDGETPLTEVGIGFKPNVDGETLENTREVTLRVLKE